MIKMNKIIISVILLMVIVGGISIILTWTIMTDAKINIPSKCYTTMQPSRFLVRSLSPAPITWNFIDNYVQIDILDRDFFYERVSDTGSMRPTISDNSLVVFIEPRIEDISEGDIIFFNCIKYGKLLHRVINISNGTYTTKGDNNLNKDVCITKFEDINGKVIGILYSFLGMIIK